MTDVTDNATNTEWVTDAELIRRSGVPRDQMRRILRSMDANPSSGFPRKDKLWGDRRHWPSVQAYWNEQQRRRMAAPNIRRAS